MDTTVLLAKMEKARQYGACHLAVYRKLADTPWESIVAQHLNALTVSAEEFIVLDSAQACVILTQLLAEDMAYEAEIMPLEEAKMLASTFCALFSDQAVFLSNSGWGTTEVADLPTGVKPKLRGWFPLTEATFDSGIIVCDSDKVGIAWFEDED